MSAPQNVCVTDAGYLVWDEVDGADGYVVEFDGKTYETDTNRLDVFDLTNFPKTYNARVMACGDLKNSDDSAWSDVCEYKVSIAKKWEFREIADGNEYSVACLDKDISGKLVFPAVGPDKSKPVTAIVGSERLKNITSVAFHRYIKSIDLRSMFCGNNLERVSVERDNPNYITDGNCVIRLEDNALVMACDTVDILDCVTSIEKYSVYNVKGRFTVPTGVTSINNMAFAGCRYLEYIDIPDSVKNIGMSAFSGCRSLKEISLPRGIENVDQYTFADCESLAALRLPSTLTSIKPDAFIGCTALQEIVIDEQNPVFAVDGNCIMRKADNAVVCGFESSMIPDNAEIVGSGAFAARKLTSVVIPEGVGVIESGAFSDCLELEEVVLPTTLKKLGGAAFAGCSKLKRCIIPYGLTEIGQYAFFECELIEHSITIPDTVTTVGYGAFSGETFYLCGDKIDPDGYAMSEPGKDDWNCDGNRCAGITMKADDGYPYVDTFTYKKFVIESVTINGITQTSISAGNYLPQDSMQIPYRKGYTFAGWATERDGAVKFGVTERTNDKTKEKYYVCLTKADMAQVSTGDTLYAVWTPEK